MLANMNEETLNCVISSLANAISTLKTEIANIDEKYKKLLEEAKSSLDAALNEAQNQYHYWLGVRGDVPMPEKKTRTRRSKKVEDPAPVEEQPVATEETSDEEEKIVDTIFEDNNIEDAVEEVVGNESEDETGETAEEEVPWTDDKPEETADSNDEASVDLDAADWPDFPEEWK